MNFLKFQILLRVGGVENSKINFTKCLQQTTISNFIASLKQTRIDISCELSVNG